MAILNFPDAFFVTGTDTDAGKTVVSAMLALGLAAHYWKPVQSGLPADSDFVAACGVRRDFIIPERFRLSQPFSPHLAARLDSCSISLQDFSLPQDPAIKRLVVEGAGGVLVPLNDKELMVDLMAHLGLPVLLVARSSLGTINHTLLSLEALRRRNLELFGVVMTGNKNRENRLAIENYGNLPVIAELPLLADFSRETLLASFTECFGETALV